MLMLAGIGWLGLQLLTAGALQIGGMLKCIHGLGEGDNGKFYTYTGKEVPW